MTFCHAVLANYYKPVLLRATPRDQVTHHAPDHQRRRIAQRGGLGLGAKPPPPGGQPALPQPQSQRRRRGGKQKRVGRKGSGNVPPSQRQQHGGDAAAGAGQPGHQPERAGQPAEPGGKQPVDDADRQHQAAACGGPLPGFLQRTARTHGSGVLVDGVLHQGQADKAALEQRQQQHDDGREIVAGQAADVLTHLVVPVNAVDAAGQDVKHQHHAAAGAVGVAGQQVQLVVDLVHPVQHVNAAGHQRQNQADGHAAGLHRRRVGAGAVIGAAVIGLAVVAGLGAGGLIVGVPGFRAGGGAGVRGALVLLRKTCAAGAAEKGVVPVGFAAGGAVFHGGSSFFGGVQGRRRQQVAQARRGKDPASILPHPRPNYNARPPRAGKHRAMRKGVQPVYNRVG